MARNDKNRLELVRGASTQSDIMYEIFRENGVFVGNDARYCCYEHPDTGLRGGLELKNVLEYGKIINKTGFLLLLQHCLFRGLGIEDASNVQLLYAFKFSFSELDLSFLAECLFERLQCTSVCLINEAGLMCNAFHLLYIPPDFMGTGRSEERRVGKEC